MAGPKARPIVDRLSEKFVVTEDGCFVWTASGNGAAGYGALTVGPRPNRRRMLAHRLAYEETVEPIPAGYELDHLCRNRACINPDHLEPVSHRENTLRGTAPTAINAAKTHCANGHELAGANLVIRSGRRGCRTCINERKRLRYAANKTKQENNANAAGLAMTERVTELEIIL